MSAEANMYMKQPPLDAVLDSYYKVDEYMDLPKLKRMKNVMKSAVSITKSKTGEVILKTNRIEGSGLNRKLDIIRKERTFAEVDLNKDKIVFKAQYKKWMDYRNKAAPSDIQTVIDRYKKIKAAVRQRQVGRRTREFAGGSLPKWGTQPFSSIIDMTGSGGSVSRRERYAHSEPGRELASRENTSRQCRHRAVMWREKTFDMRSITELLTNQKLQQESMVCKRKIDNWKAKTLERQKTIAEHFRFTRTGEIAKEGGLRGSASTVSSLHEVTDIQELIGKYPIKAAEQKNVSSLAEDSKNKNSKQQNRTASNGTLENNLNTKHKIKPISDRREKSVAFDT